MSYLLDTNVLSEARKRNSNPGVLDWFSKVRGDQLYISVLVVGEIRAGVERLRGRDAIQADVYETRLINLGIKYGDRILPVTSEVADRWGRLNHANPLPVVDGMIAATALTHGLTLVTRNVKDFKPTGVALINPFEN